ncbi:hypothetical protein B0H17DRAFT_1285034 [Mycena rosella]|uniref:F-box domain-containing protein n=1 Tax=Mycena rosella TaxID=1033263 RepID=A0AAD7FNQ2_MYCRO|nr:hypothetical protein B0H17DRAFT_1285034 [Mycena rosella]
MFSSSPRGAGRIRGQAADAEGFGGRRKDVYGFQNPAVNALWGSATLANLLCCMPPDLVVVERRSMRLLRPIRMSDWDRARVYGSRIKNLFSGPGYVELSAVFPSISLALPEKMLRNLQGLHWRHINDDFQYIYPFLSAQITTIHLSSTSRSALSLLATLAFKCPQLKDVSVLGSKHTRYSGISLSEFVHGLKCVKSLSIPTLEQADLEHLCHLLTLQRLKLGSLPTKFSAMPPLDEPFSRLRTLDIGDAAEIEAVTRLLGWCNNVPLRAFDVQFAQLATPQQIHQAYKALASGLSHSCLRSLSLINHHAQTDLSTSSEYLMRSDSIRLLLCFRNLTSVTIISMLGISFDNDTVVEMARAWPRMERSSTRDIDTDIRGRIPIGHFPSAGDHRDNQRIPGQEDPDTLALYAEEIGHHRLWKEVETLVPHLVAVRIEERVRLQNSPAINCICLPDRMRFSPVDLRLSG